jgi:formylglycine-generating enzyme
LTLHFQKSTKSPIFAPSSTFILMTATLHAPAPTVQHRLREYTANGCTFQMVQVQKGRFWMGDDNSGYTDEKPAHWVDIAQDFELGQYPVTQALWAAVMGKNPSDFKGAKSPVENVTWNDIREEGGFLDRLNALPEVAALNAKDGCRFALPSEAQWEYAARGGRYGAAFPYEFTGSNYLPEVGWYIANSQQQPQPVGRKLPNALGLYDMSGNVWEWCEDVWNDDYNGIPDYGSAQITGQNKGIRADRGGAYKNHDYSCRVSTRNMFIASYRPNYVGFRLSRYRLTP